MSTKALRRAADNSELTGAWSMNREKLISALVVRDEEMEKNGFQYPTTPRLTDWTIFIITNLDFFPNKNLHSDCACKELLSANCKK